MKDESPLEGQIRTARLSISSDGYPMSIGELTNLYRDGELVIRPEFQRLFRWSNSQKSRLIESILLGIPLPSIFVAQTEDGKWELVDGLQRVSTILQLQGELRHENGAEAEMLKLEQTEYLPAMEGKQWTGGSDGNNLTEAQRLDIKRAKIDIKIIKRESSPKAKFDLFRRLNNYGSPLSAQEMRSALLVSVSPDFFAWLEQLSSFDPFIECTTLSDKLFDERYDLELIVRFLVLHNMPEDKITMRLLRDLPKILDDETVSLALKWPDRKDELRRVFEETFSSVLRYGDENVFRRYDTSKQQFKGSFLNTAFEVFGLGIGYHVANRNEFRRDLIAAVQEFWSRPEMQSGYATGRSTEARLVQFIPEGRRLMSA